MESSLARFIAAQTDVYDSALQELNSGRKRSHWMWFIFPQLRGLGRSETSRYYGIADLAEAAAYLAHPVLGSRLIHCTTVLLNLQNASANAVFGHPDDLKFISSMTLFSQVPGAPDVFHKALQKFNGGKPDIATLDLLGLQ